MRLPQARFTLRWMMLAVAGVGIILGVSIELRRRHERFSRLAELHEARREALYMIAGGPHLNGGQQTPGPSSRIVLTISGDDIHLNGGQQIPGPSPRFFNALNENVTDWSEARFEWHRRLGKKYRRAASRPWLPVWPDPPEPR